MYPNGKHGDIDLFLITQYGSFKQTSPISFTATLSTDHLHIIELMVFFYYTCFSQNALLVNRTNNENVLKFLKKYYNPMRLNDIYLLVRDEFGSVRSRYESNIQSTYFTIKDKYLDLKNERSDIYADLVAKNQTTSKWKSEQQLFAIARKLYDDASYQYHEKWLGNQSLDIYIPSINIAIEYQGEQHYKPVELFGGVEHFHRQNKRDERKRQLCIKYGVKLIEWKYDEEISVKNFKKKIKQNI